MYRPVNSPISVRRAVFSDRPEIFRLVAQLYRDMHAHYGGTPPATDGEWWRRVTASLDRRDGKDIAIFVVDGEGGQLVSVAVGRISETLPSPRRLNVLEGYIEWVGTDPEFRQLGLASAATDELMNWFRREGALSVSLNASPAAESLYLRMGFSDDGPKALSIRLEDKLS